MRSRWQRIAIPLLAASLFASACGSDSGDGGGTDTAGESTDLAAQMLEEIESQLERPTSVGIEEPVDAVPEGKNIAVLQCRLPSCALHVGELERAAEHLGWTITPITTGTDSPEDIKEAWRAAIEMKPDGVIGIGHDRRYMNPEIAELGEMGIPVVRTNTVDETGEGLTGIILGHDSYFSVGERAARYLMSQEGDAVNAINVNLGDVIPTLSVVGEGLRATLEDECADCELADLTVPITSVGGDLAQRITAELRRNPDVNYLVIGLAEMAVGLPAALTSAGITKEDLSIVTIGTPNEAVSQYLLDENYVEATISGGSVEQNWRALDFLVRYFNEQDYEISLDDTTYPEWIITTETIPGAESFPLVEDYEEQFLQLWGVA